MPRQRATATDALTGTRLRDLRNARGMSQGAIGNVLRVSHGQIEKFENAKSRISASQLFLLAKYFGVSMDHFFAGMRELPAKRQAIRPDREGLAALEFASTKKGFNLLRAIASLESDALRDWSVTTSRFKGAHFATFPEKLVEPMVLAACRPQGLVLDPFMGAGTTALVARNLERDYLGIELNRKFVRIAQKRLQAPG